jgi:predicted ribonuclease YlaK
MSSKHATKENKKTKNTEAGMVASKYSISDLKPIRHIEPMTPNQELVFKHFEKYNLVLSGSAGSGKTFIAIYNALQMIEREGYKRQLVIVRSAVPTRDLGFLPGTLEEKEQAYLTPYIGVVNELYEDGRAFDILVKCGIIRFLTTSFIRGITLSNSIVLVDEFQNLYGRELDSIMTRIGQNSKIIFSGDFYQSDFDRLNEKEGCGVFINILDKLKYFKHVQFTWEDIVRSSTVRDYIMTKEMLKIVF